MDKDKLSLELQRLVSIMEKLRSPEGCPWDREQTLDSLQNYIIEETYEAVEAFQKNDIDLLREELGDVLLQIVFQSQVAREGGLFNLIDVFKGLSDKLIRRHPHVFADKQADTPAEVSILWDEVKKMEKEKYSTTETSILDKFPIRQPALIQAEEIQKIAAGVGFDWDDIKDVIEKVREEIDEVELALDTGDKKAASFELGDLLFSVVNLARFLNTNPELTLLKAILKFKDRFKYIEESVRGEGKDIEEMSIEELDYYWEEAKKIK